MDWGLTGASTGEAFKSAFAVTADYGAHRNGEGLWGLEGERPLRPLPEGGLRCALCRAE